MPRYAKAGVTEEDLKARIDAAGGVYELLNGDGITQRLIDDMKKVQFDCENVTDPDDEEGFEMPGFAPGYATLPNGVAVCWIGAGGDWEDPLALCVYVGDDGALRAYVPKDGNAYNFKTKAAIGNWNAYGEHDEEVGDDEDGGEYDGEYDGPHLDEVRHFGLRYEFDMDKLEADAAGRIVFKQ